MRTFKNLTWIELKLFFREPMALLFTFGFPLLLLAVLVASFGTEPEPDGFGGLIPSEYYASAYVAVVVAAVGLIALPVHLAAYRERGILRRFRASSLPTWSTLGSQFAVGLIMAIVGGVAIVGVGKLAYDIALPDSPGPLAVGFLVGTLASLSLGFLVASIARTARSAQALGLMIFFPMYMLSGSGPPPDVMGDTMRRISEGLPLTYAVRALQDPWFGSGSNLPEIAILLAVLVGAMALSLNRLAAVRSK
jgi:ABC-2 type transport system permease protein